MSATAQIFLFIGLLFIVLFLYQIDCTLSQILNFIEKDTEKRRK